MRLGKYTDLYHSSKFPGIIF